MMIKLFFITLLCAALVFADMSVQDFKDARQPARGFLSKADHLMGHSNLVRRSAAQGPPEQGPPPGPPSGGAGGSGGMGGGFDIGMNFGGGASGGASGGRS